MEKKYLYLKANKNSVFNKYIKDKNIQNYYIVGEKNIIYRICRKFKIINKLIFGLWRFAIKKYDYIILGENNYSSNISKYIKKKNPNCKIIVYYWNILNDEYKKILNDKNVDEFWTFDKNDAKEYNLKYNPQFYSKNVKLENKPIEHDVLFLGRAKDRKNDLLKIEKNFNKKGITTKFVIIESEKDFISYDQYLELLSKSKCILDYNQQGQVGLTLRPMESLFLNKKLITNNTDIVNYDFYNKNNIFVFGIDDDKKLDEFINAPFELVDEKILGYYDYNSWLERFDIK